MENTPSPQNPNSKVTVLTGVWQTTFESLLSSASESVTICAPYITEHGARIVRSALDRENAPELHALLLTDMSPLAICAGATKPAAIADMRVTFSKSRAVHLPRLHAKVYVADRARAIVTSGNLTRGGLLCNRECGLLVDDPAKAAQIDDEIAAYAALGAEIDEVTLDTMCGLAVDARDAYRAQTESASRDATRRLEAVLQSATETMMRARLAGGSVSSVFAVTIEFLLRRHGALSTVAMEPMIQEIHPDLCDDEVDRVIDGKHYGMKWKHDVRNAQQHLKRRGVIALIDGSWTLTG